MKKIFFIILTIVGIFILTACDYRAKLSKNKCNEIYNYITENFNQYEVTDYLFYDYSTELLLINKSGDLYCNKELSFFESYDYNKYITYIQHIINNFEPLGMTGYKIDSRVEYIVNVEYDYNLIEEEICLKINDFNLSLYKNSNIGLEIEICTDEMHKYSIGMIIGNIDLSRYDQLTLLKI